MGQVIERLGGFLDRFIASCGGGRFINHRIFENELFTEMVVLLDEELMEFGQRAERASDGLRDARYAHGRFLAVRLSIYTTGDEALILGVATVVGVVVQLVLCVVLE